jgi:hypothetical protein
VRKSKCFSDQHCRCCRSGRFPVGVTLAILNADELCCLCGASTILRVILEDSRRQSLQGFDLYRNLADRFRYRGFKDVPGCLAAFKTKLSPSTLKNNHRPGLRFRPSKRTEVERAFTGFLAKASDSLAVSGRKPVRADCPPGCIACAGAGKPRRFRVLATHLHKHRLPWKVKEYFPREDVPCSA